MQISPQLSVPRVQGCTSITSIERFQSKLGGCIRNETENLNINGSSHAYNCPSCTEQESGATDLAVCCFSNETGNSVEWKSATKGQDDYKDDVPYCNVANWTTQPFCSHPVNNNLNERVLLIKNRLEARSRKFACFQFACFRDDKDILLTIELRGIRLN